MAVMPRVPPLIGLGEMTSQLMDEPGPVMHSSAIQVG